MRNVESPTKTAPESPAQNPPNPSGYPQVKGNGYPEVRRKEIKKAKVMAPETREALERGRFEALRHDDGRFDAGSRLTQKELTLLFSVKGSAPFLT